MGAKPGANVFRPRPTQRDPLRAFAQVRKRDPRYGFAQIRACPPGLLRDEEAVGSNPATPTPQNRMSGAHAIGLLFCFCARIGLYSSASPPSMLAPTA
jgi:hypothetical protein